MNYSIIRYVTGHTMLLEGALMLPSCIVAILYGESTAAIALALSAALCAILGLLLKPRKLKNSTFFAKEGYVTVALCWIVISIMGSLPFLFSGSITNPIDAVFEAVSGFTTTGASILNDVEALPKGIIFWRSFTHWIGGMGVLVFLLTLLPMTGGSHMNLMKAESPGPSVSRLAPKVQTTAKILYKIYIWMTIVQIVLLLLGKMPLFDALTLSFGTAGTGGFGILNDSLASYSTYHQVVITIFMILFGINFNAFYFILVKQIKEALAMEEVKAYLLVIAASVLAITVNIMHLYDNVLVAFQQSAFQVASIITTTGYSTTDFNNWPEISRTILVMLMFIGACAGSTGGGMKVSRFLIWFKTITKEIRLYLHPKSVKQIKMDGKTIPPEVIRSTNVYLAVYVIIFAASVLLIAVDNFDSTTNFTAVAATLNNIGPGLNQVGPMSNFSCFGNFSTLILTIDMLAGRLELLPLLLLFAKDTWKKF